MKIQRVYVGFDSREQEEYEICKYSLGKSGVPVEKLEHRDLRKRGYFYRPWLISSNGQYIDLVDCKPFSTEFSHTRFLTPILARDAGIKGWVLSCDSDMIFMNKLGELDDYLDERYAVQVVMHQNSLEEGMKMDNMRQESYPRKLWSSLIAWNMKHPALVDF